MSVAQAYVTPTPIENGVEIDNLDDSSNGDTNGNKTSNGGRSENAELFTQVKYKQIDEDTGVFEFTYTNEENEASLRETVVVSRSDPDSVGVATTALPTFSPTAKPTISPTLQTADPTIGPTPSPTATVPTESRGRRPDLPISRYLCRRVRGLHTVLFLDLR